MKKVRTFTDDCSQCIDRENLNKKVEDLTENIALKFVQCFTKNFPNKHQSIILYAGNGDKGALGLVSARLLTEKGYNEVKTVIIEIHKKASENFRINLSKLEEISDVIRIKLSEDPKHPSKEDLVIDAIFSESENIAKSDESLKDWIDKLNRKNLKVIALDKPSGMPGSDEINLSMLPVVKTSLAISIYSPWLNFLLPESESFIENFEIVPIEDKEEDMMINNIPDTRLYFIEKKDIQNILRLRKPFSHKGTYGHSLIIAGSKSYKGAAILCARASIYSGCGVTSLCSLNGNNEIINASTPEVITIDPHKLIQGKIDIEKYNSIAVGCGIGLEKDAREILKTCLGWKKSLILDADALNITAKENLLNLIPANSIITPHVKEFDRLFGFHNSWKDRIKTAHEISQKMQIIILLKNRYSIIFSPCGKIYFNPTGSPAMASGGSGDALCGLITSLIAQKYSPSDAAVCGAYIHGYTSDTLAANGYFVTPPSILTENFPLSISSLINKSLPK